MSERIAQTHHNKSNRAKTHDPSDRKVVYKSVLDNPFRIQWPSVPLNIQNTLLARVVAMLEGVAEHQLGNQEINRKRKRAERSVKPRKRVKNAQDITSSTEQMAEDSQAVNVDSSPAAPPAESGVSSESAARAPSVLQHISVGINQCTKDLEGVAKMFRDGTSAPSPDHATRESSPRIVLVCRGDVDPPLLIAHLPALVAACNSTRHQLSDAAITWLVPLSKGSESSLAAAMGLRRVSVMVVKGTAPGFTELSSLLANTPILSAPWLAPPEIPLPPKTLVPTHIKQLRTSAPRDVKAAKERRAREKAIAKVQRKTKPRPKKIPKRVVVTASGP